MGYMMHGTYVCHVQSGNRGLGRRSNGFLWSVLDYWSLMALLPTGQWVANTCSTLTQRLKGSLDAASSTVYEGLFGSVVV